MSAILDAREVTLGPVDLVPPGEGRTFTVEGREVAVFRQRDGALFATDAYCPHRGAPLAEGVVGGGEVICPYHAFKFDLATGGCHNDAACSIRTYAIRAEGGLVKLRIR